MYTRTSSSRRWICTRAPSSFHSTAASPSRPSASSTSFAGRASIGRTGRPTSSRNASSAAGPVAQRRRGHVLQVAAEHERALHRRRLRPGRARERLHHHPLERALAQLATQQPPQELGLPRRRAGEQLDERIAPRSLRPRAGKPTDPLERRINLADRQARRIRRRRQVTQRRPPHTDLALAQLTRQERDAGADLVGRQPLEDGSNPLHLLEP